MFARQCHQRQFGVVDRAPLRNGRVDQIVNSVARLINADPTADLTDLPLQKHDGHLPWSDDVLTAHELVSRSGPRVRFDVTAYTGSTPW
jgi:hypothetical protein